MYGMFAFGFWYGGELIQYEGWSVGEMFSCLLCVLIGKGLKIDLMSETKFSKIK